MLQIDKVHLRLGYCQALGPVNSSPAMIVFDIGENQIKKDLFSALNSNWKP